jgi:hypothetical protein
MPQTLSQLMNRFFKRDTVKLKQRLESAKPNPKKENHGKA